MRLKYKLSILFLAVIAIGTTTTLVLVRGSTESVFRSFVFEGDMEKAEAYAVILAEYRLAKGSWDGVQEYLEKLPETVLRSYMSDRVVVADIHGVIIADTADEILRTIHPGRHLEHGVPILTLSEKTGTVLVGSMIDSSLTGVDERFLASVTKSLVWSTSVSAAIALAMGMLFAHKITKPIGILASAARSVSTDSLAMPVPVAGRDELAELSASFNDMTAELRRLDAAKKQVIADAAHELRTPLTLIQGMIEGMIDGVLPLESRTLESIHEETVRLAHLIDTLRELEIIESGELELAIAGVDLWETIEKAASRFASQAAAKSIRLETKLDGPASPLVKADRLRLDEVAYNLISNAIKFTPAGGSVLALVHPGDAAFAVFSIDDSGPGIAPAERGRVFERFYRIDKSRASGTGGRGLGLAIASEIVKAHGGSISIADSYLGGASFVVSLPVEPRASKSACV
jgi:signal transduction histidine kinase